MKGWLPFEKFKEVCGLVPRLCVDVVIKSDKGIFLTKRAVEPYKGLWHIPGGSVLFGETLNKAVKRVAKDEIGLEVKVIKMIGPVYYPSEEKVRGYPMWMVSMVYEVKAVGGKLKLNEQADEIKEFSQIPKNTIPDQLVWLKKYFKNGVI